MTPLGSILDHTTKGSLFLSEIITDMTPKESFLFSKNDLSVRTHEEPMLFPKMIFRHDSRGVKITDMTPKIVAVF